MATHWETSPHHRRPCDDYGDGEHGTIRLREVTCPECWVWMQKNNVTQCESKTDGHRCELGADHVVNYHYNSDKGRWLRL